MATLRAVETWNWPSTFGANGIHSALGFGADPKPLLSMLIGMLDICASPWNIPWGGGICHALRYQEGYLFSLQMGRTRKICHRDCRIFRVVENGDFCRDR